MGLSNDHVGPFCGVQWAAVYLDKHPGTVRRMIKDGRLKADRWGQKLMMKKADVERLAATAGTQCNDCGESIKNLRICEGCDCRFCGSCCKRRWISPDWEKDELIMMCDDCYQFKLDGHAKSDGPADAGMEI